MQRVSIQEILFNKNKGNIKKCIIVFIVMVVIVLCTVLYYFSIPVWERKIPIFSSQDLFKFGIVTDTQVHSKRVHRYGDKKDRKLLQQNTDALEKIKIGMAEFRPEFIVHLGDVIDGIGHSDSKGRAEFKLVKNKLEEINTPLYWVIGNHDLRMTTRADFLSELGLEDTNQVIDKGPYRFIILDTSFHPDERPQDPENGDYYPGYLPKRTLEWLERQLQTNKHVFVFMHQSLIAWVVPEVRGSPVGNHEEIRKMFSFYNVEAVFNGHVEWRYYKEIDGVKYYSLPGVKKNEKYHNTYYQVILKKAEPEVTIFFTDKETKEDKSERFIDRNDIYR